MNHDLRSIKAYNNPNRAQAYHEKKGFSPKRKEEMLTVTVESLVQLSKKSATLLELGAGTGHLTRKIIEANHFMKIIVSDGAKEMLDIAERELNRLNDTTEISYNLIDFSISDWTNQFSEGTFDAITSSMALHHVENKRELFSKVYKILSPQGTFVFADHCWK